MKLKIASAIIAALLSACGGNKDTPPKPVTVTPPVNQVPVVDAGTDITADEQTAVTLSGQATDNDGSITSYTWTQVSGTTVTLSNLYAAQTSFIAPDVNANETLIFSLKVTDNDGAQHSDEISVNVKHINILPVASAGPDVNADEDSVLIIKGTGTDRDGSISSYSWRQISGSDVILTNADQAELTVTLPDLEQDETMSFELTVTDNSGGIHSDTIQVNALNVEWQIQDEVSLKIDADDLKDRLFIQHANGKTNRLAWQKNIGDGNFSNTRVIDANYPLKTSYMKATEVDGRDGRDILLVAGEGIHWYQNEGNNNFKPRASLSKDWTDVELPDFFKSSNGLTNTYTPKYLALTDLTADGLMDLVWTTVAPAKHNDADDTSYLYISLNNGKGQFEQPKELMRAGSSAAGESSTSLLLANFEDIDKDNINDLVLIKNSHDSMFGGSYVSVYLYTSGNNFDTLTSGTSPYHEPGNYAGVFFTNEQASDATVVMEPDNGLQVFVKLFFSTYLFKDFNGSKFESVGPAPVSASKIDLNQDIDRFKNKQTGLQ